MTKRCADVLPLLSALADGALDETERSGVEEHLRGCAGCPDRLLFLRAQGSALREMVAARTAAADFDGFADRVLARARVEKPRVLDGAGVWAREMLGAHRAFAGAAGFALAACMALAVVFMPQQPVTDDGAADTDSQVEEVDFGTHDGAVLQLPNQTTVIWMSEDRGAGK